MKIIFSEHAKYQILERGLSKDEVLVVVINPQQVISQDENLLILQSIFNYHGKSYLIRVVTRMSEDSKIVVTAYKTSKVEKYWRVDL